MIPDSYINKFISFTSMAIICISIPDKMHKTLEDKRGDIPRSLQYQRILKKECEVLKKS